MPTVVTTVGGSTSNSYISVAAAATYFDERLNVDAWDSASADDKARALIMATRRLDHEDWEGVKVAESQALDWPRYWATDEDGEEYESNEIPTVVQDATCELALRLLADKLKGKDTFADTGLEEFTKAQIGPMNVERNRAYMAGQLPAAIARMLSHVRTSSGASARMSRA